MNYNEQKKREIAEKLSVSLRAYNSLKSPNQWIGYEEIDAIYSALAYSDGNIDAAFQQLIYAAEMVQEDNQYGKEVRHILKQAQALFLRQYFTYYRLNIIFELTSVKRIFR
jgi:hypothetical protein